MRSSRAAEKIFGAPLPIGAEMTCGWTVPLTETRLSSQQADTQKGATAVHPAEARGEFTGRGLNRGREGCGEVQQALGWESTA